MEDSVGFIFEWAVWSALDRHRNIELILLKGHLMLESMIESKLDEHGCMNSRKFSFYKKCVLLEEFEINGELINALLEINRLRNHLAHNYVFDQHEESLVNWAKQIHLKFPSTKFTKYTKRTEIIQAFSALSGHLMR